VGGGSSVSAANTVPQPPSHEYELVVCHGNVIRYFVCRCLCVSVWESGVCVCVSLCVYVCIQNPLAESLRVSSCAREGVRAHCDASAARSDARTDMRARTVSQGAANTP